MIRSTKYKYIITVSQISLIHLQNVKMSIKKKFRILPNFEKMSFFRHLIMTFLYFYYRSLYKNMLAFCLFFFASLIMLTVLSVEVSLQKYLLKKFRFLAIFHENCEHCRNHNFCLATLVRKLKTVLESSHVAILGTTIVTNAKNALFGHNRLCHLKNASFWGYQSRPAALNVTPKPLPLTVQTLLHWNTNG